ncbi:MAG: polysaccharide pyruvyl transferase family protein [Armatimonadetes bacterium]|nr:polysaccharide pyruvyl transferase family protein [Armatimonadota bacterium]
MSKWTENDRLAIIVPGCFDLNKGDQALVWETIELIKDVGVANEIAIVGSADEVDQCENQTRELGHTILPGLLPHPRRGKYRPEDRIKEGRLSLALMIAHSIMDFVRGQLFLLVARFPLLAGFLLGKRQRKTYEAFLRARVVVVKGGGFVHSYGGLSAPYLMWYQLFYINLAHRLGKPVVVLPNSFGPFVGLWVRRQVKKALGSCEFVCARESISAKALGELLGRDVPVFPDLGYFLPAADDETGLEICRRFGVPIGSKRCVGFTVRPYRFPGSRDPSGLYDRYLESLAFLVRHVASLGFHPVFVTQVLGPSAHENDSLAILDLIKRLDGVEYSWVDHDGTCRELKSVYGCMDYVVGTRFHSVVFAQGLEVPSMAIAYGGNKATGIMKDMGLAEYVVPIDEVTGERLCGIFDNMLGSTEYVKHKLGVNLAKAQVDRNRLVSELQQLLKL